MSTLTPADDKTRPSATEPAAPPVAPKVHTENHINGGRLVDDYRWLREKSNPEVAKYLEAENAYADAIMKPTEALQQKLYAEMVSHIKETDVNVPYREGAYFYYSRWEQGKQYPIFGRKKASLDASEEITLDQNELAKGQPFMALGGYEVSEDCNLLAYSTDNTGFRQYKLYVRDLRTGRDSPEIADKVGSIAWANDNQTLFYSVEEDKTKRQYRLYRHKLGTPGPDQLIYEEPDERFNIGVGRTRSGRYLIVEIGSHTTSEVRFFRANDPSARMTLVQPRPPSAIRTTKSRCRLRCGRPRSTSARKWWTRCAAGPAAWRRDSRRRRTSDPVAAAA